MTTRQDWQKLAVDNGKLLARVIQEDRREMVEGVVASIERCNVQAAKAGVVNNG